MSETATSRRLLIIALMLLTASAELPTYKEKKP
jgi:hypothetical protein